MKVSGFILIVVMNLTSCVGIGIVGGKKEEQGHFAVNRTRSAPMRRVSPSEDGRNPTRDELRSNWGEPDKRRHRHGEELWSYQSGLAIRGAIPMLGFGIPLVAPVGKNSYDVHFREGTDRAEKLVIGRNDFKGGYFGVSAFSDSKGFGFHKLGE